VDRAVAELSGEFDGVDQFDALFAGVLAYFFAGLYGVVIGDAEGAEGNFLGQVDMLRRSLISV
jgi:hypothetical protein